MVSPVFFFFVFFFFRVSKMVSIPFLDADCPLILYCAFVQTFNGACEILTLCTLVQKRSLRCSRYVESSMVIPGNFFLFPLQ